MSIAGSLNELPVLPRTATVERCASFLSGEVAGDRLCMLELQLVVLPGAVRPYMGPSHANPPPEARYA